MPQHKKHHYVPVCYLKRFAKDEDGKCINLYHLPSHRFVENASLKDQAYENRFYVQQIEEGLGILESRYGKIVQKILKCGQLESLSEEESVNLCIFAVLLASRTRCAAEETNDTVDKVSKLILGQIPQYRGKLEDLKFDFEETPSWRSSWVANMYPLYTDLELCLLSSRGHAQFITSDNPGVFYNQFAEAKNASLSYTSLACKGLQLFVPLSPDHYLLCYDSDVYNVENRDLPAEDVFALNAIQYVNADEHLYYGAGVSREAIAEIIEKGQNFRTPGKSNVEGFKSVGEDGNLLNIRTSKDDIRCRLELNTISMRNRAKTEPFDDRKLLVRDKNMCILSDMYRSILKAEGIEKLSMANWLENVKNDPYERELCDKFVSHVQSRIEAGSNYAGWRKEVKKHEGR